MNNKIKVGILGATGMVGQKFITLLNNHPWFEVVVLAASPRSAGSVYGELMEDRWAQSVAIPSSVKDLTLYSVADDKETIAEQVDMVFSAMEADKDMLKKIEEDYASLDVPVVSNNSAHRWTEDVPMIIPEVNPDHTDLVDIQRKNRGWNKGLIAVKSNCSIQSYVPLLKAWEEFVPNKVLVTTLQAISGAGKTFETWPEMVDNVNPLIGGEEAKSEKEPMKVLGTVTSSGLELKDDMAISATCTRVPVLDGHMASLSVSFEKEVGEQELIEALANYKNPIADMKLPSAPEQFITYMEEEDRPQSRLDRDNQNGMGITAGRLRKDSVLDWKCIGLSHNTVRGAAGGAVLLAELLVKKEIITA